MIKPLIFHKVTIDTHEFQEGVFVPKGVVIQFFNASFDSDQSDVTKQNEEEIIRWLLHTRFRNLLLDRLAVGPDVFIDQAVRQPVIENTQGKPGDIDILICPFRRPDIAIAIQCKPVIVKALNEEDDDDVKKLGRIPDLVEQSYRQRNTYGFHRNYLAILIKVDGRKKMKYNSLFRGPNPDTFQSIYEFPDREKVHKDVGIIFIEIVQPTGKSFELNVDIGVCVDVEAARLEQNDSLTNRIQELMRRKGVTFN